MRPLRFPLNSTRPAVGAGGDIIGHSAHAYIPVYYLSQIAHGDPDPKYGPPANLMERVARWPGTVDLGYDTWDFIAAMFDQSSDIIKGSENDMLYMTDTSERWAIAHARDLAKEMSRDNPDRQRWIDVKDAIKLMRAHRLALGLCGIEWNLG